MDTTNEHGFTWVQKESRASSGVWRKKGFVAVMKEFWEEVGYAELNLTSQNLLDKVTSLEKIMGM